MSNSALNEKVLNQVEFYFSDSNFRKDKFMQATAKADPEGWIAISTLLTFNKLKALTTEESVVAEALKESSTVQVSADGTKAKRSAELPANDDSATRTLYVKGYPTDDNTVTIESISQQFSTYGKVLMVTLRRTALKEFKGAAFIEFASADAVKAAVAAANVDNVVQIGHKDTKFDCVMPYVEWQQRKEAKRAKFIAKVDEKKEKKAVEATEKSNEVKEVQYTPGMILKVTGVPTDISLYDLKDFFKKLGTVSFVDYAGASESNGVAHVRAGDVDSAKAIAAGLKEGKTARDADAKFEVEILAGEEEKSYWEKIVEAGKNKNGNGKRGRDGPGGGRGGRGGRGGGRGGRGGGRGFKKQRN